jgi:hypothetical protein
MHTEYASMERPGQRHQNQRMRDRRRAGRPTASTRASTRVSTYQSPRQHAAGLSLVIVNGVITWRDGRRQHAAYPLYRLI